VVPAAASRLSGAASAGHARSIERTTPRRPATSVERGPTESGYAAADDEPPLFADVPELEPEPEPDEPEFDEPDDPESDDEPEDDEPFDEPLFELPLVLDAALDDEEDLLSVR